MRIQVICSEARLVVSQELDISPELRAEIEARLQSIMEKIEAECRATIFGDYEPGNFETYLVAGRSIIEDLEEIPRAVMRPDLA